LASRDVIGHVTIRLPGVNFLWVVHGENASTWHRYRDMAPQRLDARTWTRKEKRKKKKRKERERGKKKKKKWKGKRKEEGEREENEKGM